MYPQPERLLLVQPLGAAFQTLRVGAAVFAQGTWYAIHARPRSVTSFEAAHGKVSERYAYNRRAVERAYQTGRPSVSERAGFYDLFYPVRSSQRVEGVIVTGPFATRRPTSAEVLERWHWLTGRQGHPLDPEFSFYVTTTLDVLTLEGDQASRFERWVGLFADVLSGEGNARRIVERALEQLPKLEQTRFVDRAWNAIATMVDERTEREWMAPHSKAELQALGLSRLPEHVLFGLISSKNSEIDPVEELLRRDQFQRECVALAHESGVAVAGRVGEHAVALLVTASQSSAQLRTALQHLSDRVRSLAKRFGLSLHFGASAASGLSTLSARYEQAMSAAERAISQGRALVHAERGEQKSLSPIRRLRRDLGRLAEERPSELDAIFERYAQAVIVGSRYRLDLVRAHLEAGLDELVRPLLASRVLDEKAYGDVCSSMDTSLSDATSVGELAASYRLAISDLTELITHPAKSARDRSLRRAVIFVHGHFTEPLSSANVAKLAGFAPAHFCRLFKQRERVTFEQYLRGLRVERAKQLLTSTELSVERVGQLSGFPQRSYFHRAFRQAVSVTPVAYRQGTR